MCDQNVLPHCFPHTCQELELANKHYEEITSSESDAKSLKKAQLRLDRAKLAYSITEEGLESLREKWTSISDPEERKAARYKFYYYKRKRKRYLLKAQLATGKLQCQKCNADLTPNQTVFCSPSCLQEFRKDNHVRRCKQCSRTPDEVEFSKHPNTIDGLSIVCKECNRSRTQSSSSKYSSEKQSEIKARRKTDSYRSTALKRTYGIDLPFFNHLLKNQKNKCAICKIEFADSFKPHVDHDHATGKVRGLLCKMCNVALGRFKDDIDTLNKALHYLKLSSDPVHSQKIMALLAKRKRETRFNFIAAKGGAQMSQEGRLRLLESQGFMCACCGDDLSHLNFRKIHIDHDHKNLLIRGALCHYCNIGLGPFYEDEARFRAAIAYLEAHAAAA